jgi:hypothetical protein
MSNPWVSRYSTSLIISESLGLFGLSNPWVSHYISLLIISESIGLFGRRIHGCPVTALR